MESLAELIILLSVIGLILFMIYKVVSWIIVLVIRAIRRRTILKNEDLILAEIKKTEQMLNNRGIERMSREEAIKKNKNYTGIL